VFLLPNLWWAAALLAVMLLAAWEWGALGGYGILARWLFCGAVVVCAVALYSATGAKNSTLADAELLVYAGSCAFWVLVVPPWLAARWQVRAPLVVGAAGLVVLLPAWLAVARLQSDPVGLLQLLGIVWLADTAAFLAGRRWGKRKLAPTISPGKTWEGVAGAAVAVAVYYVVLSGSASARSWAHGWSGVMFFAGVTAVSVAGDLLESWMKRCAGVKDSGALLPGHGGILDRVDGLLASMPLAALFTKYAG